MHTPLITKIQVYIFVVCCCLIFFPLRYKGRHNFSTKKLNLYKQSIINVKMENKFSKTLVLRRLENAINGGNFIDIKCNYVIIKILQINTLYICISDVQKPIRDSVI